ncbi:MAG: hypothetical protein AAFR61_25045 [Bacteroidota bacterium]
MRHTIGFVFGLLLIPSVFLAQTPHPTPTHVLLAMESPDQWETSGFISTESLSEDIPTTFYTLQDLQVSEAEFEDMAALQAPAMPLIQYYAEVMPGETQINFALGEGEGTGMVFLQKSLDQQRWKTIKAVFPLDPSHASWHRQVSDGEKTKGVAYYRLAQLNPQEDTLYSPALVVERFPLGHHVSHLYPNPAVFGTMVQLELYQAAQVEIRLIDAENRSLGKVHTAFASLGRHEIELDLSRLPKKKYLCEIRVGNHLAIREIQP